MAELKTWMDLPKHPNIAPCHFFRTVEDGLANFPGSMQAAIQRS